MRRMVLLLGSIALALAPSSSIAQQRAAPPSPNVVVILADDLGYGDLSSFGATDLRTPNLDALAGAGVRFDNFYANSPVCSPTRAALLSGRVPDLVGMPGVVRTHAGNSWGYLSRDALLLPELLRRAGYQTAIVGKWHLGLEWPNLPHARGFDHVYAFWGDMMDDYETHRRHGINYMRRGAEEIDPVGHATDLFTSEAVDYIRSRAASPAPFFLYLAYNAPHVPVQPPQAWLERVRRREPGLEDRRAKLVALIEHMDDGIGQVVRALRETGAYDNTLIVFTSDNGGELPASARNGPFRGSKTEMYEGGLRVPAIAVWPGRIPQGSRSDALLLSMDLYPTLAEAAGVTIRHPIDAHSFLTGMLGRGAYPAHGRPLVWVRREGNREMGHPVYAVRSGDWKLVHNRPWEPFQLFNLREDPREERDLSAGNREKYDELAALLRSHVLRTGGVPWQPAR